MFLIFVKKLLNAFMNLWTIVNFFFFFFFTFGHNFFSIFDLIACFSLRDLWSLTRLLFLGHLFFCLFMFYIHKLHSFFLFFRLTFHSFFLYISFFFLSYLLFVTFFFLYFILSSCHTFHWSKLKRSSSSSL